jgi:hypothetical protein
MLPLCLLALWGISFVVVRCVDCYVCALAWYWQVPLIAGGPLIFALALVVLCSPLYLLMWLVFRAEERDYREKEIARLEGLLESENSAVRESAAAELRKLRGEGKS